MKKILLHSLLLIAAFKLNAQQTGDTIVVKAFKYGSGSRDTAISFPNNPSQTYEKIIMKYNMRCKNNQVSNQTSPNLGCGEWDYSCNTYIVDSSKIEKEPNTAPSHIISNFSGTVFPYTSQPLFDYYNFSQTSVTLNNIVSETQYTVGTGSTAAPNVLKANERSGRTQLLFTAAELTAAGLTAGNIDGLLLSVANAGGTVNFLRVGMQNSSASGLDPGALTLTGFATVFNSNRTFTAGNNRVQFYTPFVWNGTSNVLVDLSFTSTGPASAVVLNGVSTSTVRALYTNNNYALDLAAMGQVTLNTMGLSGISNELTVTFWAYGNAGLLPANTVMMCGYGINPAQRDLNLHLPWSDGNMYYDCGYSNGGYDRINKAATASEQGGQWNHWAFTKNSVTGDMKIYLNGVLWHSGTGKTKPMSILNILLGKDQSQANNWKGKLNELMVWNKELSLADIQGWMNKVVDNTHPFYTNLLAYYKMNEGSGQVINETKNSVTANGVNLQWTYDRGNKLDRTFRGTLIRPNVTFVRGTYALTTITVIVKDSVQRNPSIIQQYSITSNATAVPMAHDLVSLVTTTTLNAATPLNVYNGDTGVLTGTLASTAQGTLTVTPLNYIRRYPFYNEIMSFVTPYGKGLSMGANGKSWFYDVSDLAPVLKGQKRLVMNLGGEYQEQMDLDFWFIVGTPPRNVIEFNQLWQGAGRAGGASIGSINNDTRFPVLTVPAASNGQAFKLRSTITGHGAQGEFKQNGGTINHFFNVNGGPAEFTWQITEECARNVIFPQGGTWVYDREGWCPGQASLMKEYNLTPHITPGSTVTLDYGCSTPPNPSGDYRYIVANQVITYSGANHSIDARILDVMHPSNKVLYSRANPACASPVIMVQNSGSTALTSLEIDYWMNSAASKETYTWTGNLAFMDTALVTLPIGTLWQNGTLPSGNVFHAELKKANMAVDQYSYNNSYASPFTAAAAITTSFTIEFKTNTNYLENSYVLYDDQGNIAGSSNFTAPNTLYTDAYEFNGCYRLVVEDTGNDGVSWWANGAQGTGYIKLRNSQNVVVKTFEPDFGAGFEYSFTTYDPLGIANNSLDAQVNLYPNPSRGQFMLEGSTLEGADIYVTDLLGHRMAVQGQKNGSTVTFNSSSLVPGMYLVCISKDGSRAVKKVMVN